MKSFAIGSLQRCVILAIFLLGGITIAQDSYEDRIQVFPIRTDTGARLGVHIAEGGDNVTCEIDTLAINNATPITVPNQGGYINCGGLHFSGLGFDRLFYRATIPLIINGNQGYSTTVDIPTIANNQIPQFRWYIFNGQPDFTSVASESGESREFKNYFVSVNEQSDQVCSNSINHTRDITFLVESDDEGGIIYQGPQLAYEQYASPAPTTLTSFDTLLAEPLRVYTDSMQGYRSSATLTIDIFTSLTDDCVFPGLSIGDAIGDDGSLTDEIEAIIQQRIDDAFTVSEGNEDYRDIVILVAQLDNASIVIKLRSPNDAVNIQLATVVGNAFNNSVAVDAFLGGEVTVAAYVLPLGNPLADEIASRDLHILSNPIVSTSEAHQSLLSDVINLYESYDLPIDLLPFQNDLNNLYDLNSCYENLTVEESIPPFWEDVTVTPSEEIVILGNDNYVIPLQGQYGIETFEFQYDGAALVQPNYSYPDTFDIGSSPPVSWFNTQGSNGDFSTFFGTESVESEVPIIIPSYDGYEIYIRQFMPDENNQIDWNTFNEISRGCAPIWSP